MQLIPMTGHLHQGLGIARGAFALTGERYSLYIDAVVFGDVLYCFWWEHLGVLRNAHFAQNLAASCQIPSESS